MKKSLFAKILFVVLLTSALAASGVVLALLAREKLDPIQHELWLRPDGLVQIDRDVFVSSQAQRWIHNLRWSHRRHILQVQPGEVGDPKLASAYPKQLAVWKTLEAQLDSSNASVRWELLDH